jgi:hypothetical protein
MVRLHDQYGMHDIFAPGFPGLLEAFYVMERMMEWIMPDVYKTFVSAHTAPTTLTRSISGSEVGMLPACHPGCANLRISPMYEVRG